jgi:hypothetical protein
MDSCFYGLLCGLGLGSLLCVLPYLFAVNYTVLKEETGDEK